MLKMYMYDMRVLDDEKEYKRMFDKASEYRREKALKGRKKEHIGAAAVLDMALEEFGLAENKIALTYGEHGKPYISKNMNITPYIYYNISHSGDYVVCAVSDTEIGIDIQKTGKANIKIAKRYFTQTEYMNIIKQPDEKSQGEMFFRIWALKESFIKAVGTGMSLSLNSFEIIIDDRNCVTVNQNYKDSTFRFEEHTVPGYVIAICREI